MLFRSRGVERSRNAISRRCISLLGAPAVQARHDLPAFLVEHLVGVGARGLGRHAQAAREELFVRHGRRCVRGHEPSIEPDLHEHLNDIARRKPEKKCGSNHWLQRGEALQNAEHGKDADCTISKGKMGSAPNRTVHHLGLQIIHTGYRRGLAVETKPRCNLFASSSQVIAGRGASVDDQLVAGARRSKMRSSIEVREPLASIDWMQT